MKLQVMKLKLLIGEYTKGQAYEVPCILSEHNPQGNFGLNGYAF